VILKRPKITLKPSNTLKRPKYVNKRAPEESSTLKDEIKEIKDKEAEEVTDDIIKNQKATTNEEEEDNMKKE